VTRLSAKSNSFLRYHLADLAHNHLAKLVISMIHSDCHFTMRTGESMQRLKLVARMSCSLYLLAGVEVFFNLGPRTLEILRAPRYLNPALLSAARYQTC